MDLYEALKAGTSAEELLKTFNRDLSAAQTRIDEEKEAEAQAAADKEHLEFCRTILAEAIVDYAEAYCGKEVDDDILSVEEVEKTLINLEKDMEKTISFSKRMSKFFDEFKSEKKNPTLKINSSFTADDDIINAFLKSFK